MKNSKNHLLSFSSQYGIHSNNVLFYLAIHDDEILFFNLNQDLNNKIRKIKVRPMANPIHLVINQLIHIAIAVYLQRSRI